MANPRTMPPAPELPVVKESSDEFNPAVLTAPTAIDLPPRSLSGADHLALALATCGVGRVPVAPGTWGAGVGIGVYVLFNVIATTGMLAARDAGWNGEGALAALEALRTSGLLILLLVLVRIGIWAASRAEPLLGRKDPQAVVIDEVAGQVMTFVFVPSTSPAWMLFAGFVLFRLFDIWKPYPIDSLQNLPAGIGVCADDILAGVYAGTCLALIYAVSITF